MPLISIVVPVYKAENYIECCVDSILSQSFSDYELILVDDGSPDKSGEICDTIALRDSRVSVIHKQNGGATSARICGADNAAGEYVLAVDSDDSLLPGILEKIAYAVSHYSADIVVFNFIRDGAGLSWRCPEKFRNRYLTGAELEDAKRLLIYDPSGPGLNWGIVPSVLWNKVIRRSLYLKCQRPVPLQIKRGEDLAVTAPAMISAESVYFLDFDGYLYRDNEMSIMNTFREDSMQLLSLLRGYLLKHTLPENENSVNVFTLSSVSDYILDAARHFNRKKDYMECVKKNITPDLIAAVKKAKVSHPSFKETVRTELIRYRFYGLIRTLIKN